MPGGGSPCPPFGAKLKGFSGPSVHKGSFPFKVPQGRIYQHSQPMNYVGGPFDLLHWGVVSYRNIWVSRVRYHIPIQMKLLFIDCAGNKAQINFIKQLPIWHITQAIFGSSLQNIHCMYSIEINISCRWLYFRVRKEAQATKIQIFFFLHKYQ